MPTTDNTTTTTNVVGTNCWSCGPLQEYVNLSKDFADNLSTSLHDPMLNLFLALAGLWIVLSGLRLHFRMTDINGIIKDFVFITITGVLLGGQGEGLIATVYSAAIDIMGGASAAVFSLAGNAEQSSGHTGLVALAANGELAVAKVFQAAEAIAKEGALYKPQYYVYAFLLVLPYFLLVVVYSSQVVVAIFRAALVGVFAPFLFMAFAFGWGRSMAVSGAKTLLASILVLFACTAALSLCVYGVNSMELDPAKLIGDDARKFANVANTKFLVVLFLGWAGTALMTEGTAIANSIAQTYLTNAASGIMASGGAASALFGLSKGGQLGKFLGGKGAEEISDQAKALLDKFKNVNQPNDKGGGAA